MALPEAVFGAIADLTNIAINVIAKKFGKSEVQVKQIEGYLFWFLLVSFILFLFYLTFKYS